MVCFGCVAIRTDIHTGMIDIDFQPGVGNMATTAGSRIMVYQTGVTVAAIAQGVIKNRSIPNLGSMTIAALPYILSCPMCDWRLVAGSAIRGRCVFK
jgi:hypothetical protein